MKVFNKWLVMVKLGKHDRVVAHFARKDEAEEALTASFAKRDDNDWEDEFGRHFRVEKNTKEYR